MRLLQCQANGGFSLTEDLVYEDLPRYAILSHTWGPNKEEVTFEDIASPSGSARRKAGYKKIQFCSEQAAKDNLQHFWVDTCCIKKSSDSELSASINSMYRWYQKATRCYVYLADVPQVEWEGAFAGSKWFTRGWTLQELLAPTSVEFFSSEGVLLGDKQSMRLQIHEITGIAVKALQGSSVTSFTVAERRGWAAKRVTKLEEDGAYCLVGILGISMAPRYGEGREQAFKRLESKISKASNGALL
jgi:Heterokaryon incompatibility protein (HET)